MSHCDRKSCSNGFHHLHSTDLQQPAQIRCLGIPCRVRHWCRCLFPSRLVFAFLILSQNLALAEGEPKTSSQSLIVVVGAGGTPQYEISFYQWSERWVAAARQAGVAVTVIGRHRGEEKIEETDYDRLKAEIAKANSDSQSELWIVLIGHGTFDRRVARFNLRGPDVSANELKEWLSPIQRPTAIINCASASGPFIPALSAPQRIVISATKSGAEMNFSRFGDHLSQAIGNPTADLDKDNQTSLWEAFLMASRRTAEYYDTDGRIATEHALLDDNGDGSGVRADEFRGLVPIAPNTDTQSRDGRRAHQWHLIPNSLDAALLPEIRARRNELELSIEQLRSRKSELPSQEYLKQLEDLLVQLAELNEMHEQ